MDCEKFMGKKLGTGKNVRTLTIRIMPFLSRTVTSTWSMGRMFAEWRKVLCMLKFEEQKQNTFLYLQNVVRSNPRSQKSDSLTRLEVVLHGTAFRGLADEKLCFRIVCTQISPSHV